MSISCQFCIKKWKLLLIIQKASISNYRCHAIKCSFPKKLVWKSFLDTILQTRSLWRWSRSESTANDVSLGYLWVLGCKPWCLLKLSILVFEICIRVQKVKEKRDHPFKTSANFHTFLTPTPIPSAVFLVLSVGKFGKFLTPPLLEHADVLNGWSQRKLMIDSTDGFLNFYSKKNNEIFYIMFLLGDQN